MESPNMYESAGVSAPLNTVMRVTLESNQNHVPQSGDKTEKEEKDETKSQDEFQNASTSQGDSQYATIEHESKGSSMYDEEGTTGFTIGKRSAAAVSKQVSLIFNAGCRNRAKTCDSFVRAEDIFSKPSMDGCIKPIYSQEEDGVASQLPRTEFRRATIGSTSEIVDGIQKLELDGDQTRSYDDSLDQGSLQYEDQRFPHLLQDSIRELALGGKFYDVVLEVDDHKFKCHRMILSAGSPYFRAMFCNSHREKDQACINIGGISADVMKTIIRYAYTSYLEINRDNAQTVLEAASLLQFNRVVQACADYFASQVSVENAPGIMELASRHNLQTLLVHSRLECVTKFEQLQEKSDFVVLSPSLLESIICREDLAVGTEETVFHLVMEWCRHGLPERKEHLPRLLRHVKLCLLDPVFFVRHVETDALISCNPKLHDLLMKCRLYHSEGKICDVEGLVPRIHSDTHQVFLTVGGCDKNDTFSREICVLDFQHKSRSTFGQLPNLVVQNTTQIAPTKWAEFACCEWLGNLAISGGKETRKESWIFLTTMHRWVELPRLNTGRWRHRMVTCKGTLYAVGGYDGLLRVDSIEKYNRKENVWNEQKPMREGVSSAAVCVAKDQIYVFGGGPSIKIATEKAQVFNPDTNDWRLTTPMPEPCKCVNATVLNDIAYVVGGTLREFLQFNLLTESWSRGVRLNYERASSGLTVCSGKIFVVGGRAEDSRAVANVSYLDLEAGEMRSECNMPGGISHHGCVTLQKYNANRKNRFK